MIFYSANQITIEKEDDIMTILSVFDVATTQIVLLDTY